jgi:hypothetical protein
MIVDNYDDISRFCVYRDVTNPGCHDCSFALERDGRKVCTAILAFDLTDDRNYYRQFGRGYNE